MHTDKTLLADTVCARQLKKKEEVKAVVLNIKNKRKGMKWEVK